jgi:hypothetical protein
LEPKRKAVPIEKALDQGTREEPKAPFAAGSETKKGE